VRILKHGSTAVTAAAGVFLFTISTPGGSSFASPVRRWVPGSTQGYSSWDSVSPGRVRRSEPTELLVDVIAPPRTRPAPWAEALALAIEVRTHLGSSCFPTSCLAPVELAFGTPGCWLALLRRGCCRAGSVPLLSLGHEVGDGPLSVGSPGDGCD
jgi:hypothetical protein